MLIHIFGGLADISAPAAFALKDDEHYIGRMPSCPINIPDDSVSRLHARVYKKDGDWWIEDLRSRNGVLINSRSVKDSKIVEGDIITIGDLYFTLSYRRPDQINEIKDWIADRLADAESYHQDILRFKIHATQPQDTGRIPKVQEAYTDAYAAAASGPPISAMTPPPPAAPQYPDPNGYDVAYQIPAHAQSPWQPSSAAQTPQGYAPQQPIPGHPTPAFVPQPARPPVSAPRRRPQAQTVIDSDPTVIVICPILGLLAVFALIWRFTDWFR